MVAIGRELFTGYTEADFDAMDQPLRKLKQRLADHGADQDVCPTSLQHKETH